MQYYMSSGCPRFSYLAFVDDVLIFVNGDKRAVVVLMALLREYEAVSGQAISPVQVRLLHRPSFPAARRRELAGAAAFLLAHPPFKYLGCPLTIGKRNMASFDPLIGRIFDRILG
ncbi:uncharacterized protein M6B38_131755 [Iris pallida]|uniref:Reverse transcriptase domain-containing protein n=1 Tax=Iris pallida TaxID=29817 RepID=A0AAX6FQP2_IRIPA|nr:uncharacterized protein M6B38_131755 [Iris pallida]